MDEADLIEALADKEHASWARWMAYLFSRCQRNDDGSLTIATDDVTHWQWEIDTAYTDLPEHIKKSDREEVAHILPIIKSYVSHMYDIVI